MEIKSEDITKICQAWRSEVQNWQATAENDENAYEIEDDDYASSKQDGAAQAKEKTGGFDGDADNTSSAVTTGVNVLGGAGGAVVGILTTIASLSKTGTKKDGNAWLAMAIGTALLANAVYLKAARPNKDAADACETLTGEMSTAQGALATTQSDMEDSDSKLIELGDEASEYNEETNETIEEDKTEFDFYRASYEALMAKVEAGETLTEDEKALLAELVPIMQELGLNIEEITEETSENVEEIYEEMEEYQDSYDESAETIAEIEGLTDYAAGFDEDTADNAEMIADTTIFATLGCAGVVTSGTLALTAKSISLDVGEKVAAGIAIGTGVAGGILYNMISEEQDGYKATAEAEIAERVATQDLNAETSDIYDERVEDYEGYMETIEELELEVPEDMEAPEETPVVPTGKSDPKTGASGEPKTGTSGGDNKDKEEKEPKA